MTQLHLPLIPDALLRRHHVNEPTDTRFRSNARLLQALWREDRELPIGTYSSEAAGRRKLGNLISPVAGRAGENFLDAEIGYLVERELAYREPGAMIDETRLRTNLLSSMPLSFNVFGPLKLDLRLATAVACRLWPGAMATVTGVSFEHSPGRGDPAYTQDYSAFDVLITGETKEGEAAFVALEIKYSESMLELPPRISPRHAEWASGADIYRDPLEPRLRQRPLQQLYRLHMLATAIQSRKGYPSGHFAVIAPRLNLHVRSAVDAYQAELLPTPRGVPTFGMTALEEVISAIGDAGAEAHAEALFRRYCDFELVDGEIELFLAERRDVRRAATLAEPVSESEAA